MKKIRCIFLIIFVLESSLGYTQNTETLSTKGNTALKTIANNLTFQYYKLSNFKNKIVILKELGYRTNINEVLKTSINALL